MATGLFAATYTCPMHPEVRQHGSSRCPKCGMALEREVPRQPSRAPNTSARCIPRSCATRPAHCPICGMALEPRVSDRRRGQRRTRRHDAALLDQRRAGRAAFRHRHDGRILAAGFDARIAPRALQLDRVPARDAGRVCGRAGRFFVRGWQSVVNRHLNMFTLIALGAGVAFGLQRGGRVRCRRSFRRTFRDCRRCRSGLFRGRGGDHRAGAARPGAGAARAQPHRVRRSRCCSGSRRRPRASCVRTDGRGRAAGPGQAGRSAARAARRTGAGRRHGARRCKRGRRIDGHRRAASRSRRSTAIASSAQRSTAPAAS